jgi:alkylhydroperoxidase family enzyme
MIRYWIGRRISAAEKALGASMEYLRHILRVSLGEFVRFWRFGRLADRRRTLPPAPFYVARLVAVLHEDCGDCVQIEAALARRDGVPASVLKAVVGLRPSDLPEELADVYLFTECVTQNAGDAETLRAKVRRRYGEEGLVEIAQAIAFARVSPVVKRSLGYASACEVKSISIEE